MFHWRPRWSVKCSLSQMNTLRMRMQTVPWEEGLVICWANSSNTFKYLEMWYEDQWSMFSWPVQIRLHVNFENDQTLGGNLICTNGVISKTVSNMRGAYHWLGQSALTTNGGWLKSKLNISLNKLNIKQTTKQDHVDGLWHNLMVLSKWEIGQKQFCYAKKDESHSTLFEQWWLQLWTLPL